MASRRAPKEGPLLDAALPPAGTYRSTEDLVSETVRQKRTYKQTKERKKKEKK